MPATPNPDVDPVAAAILDAYPLDDITTWSTDQLRELAEWNVAVLAADPDSPVVELTWDPPHFDSPEHGVTPVEELDNPYGGGL